MLTTARKVIILSLAVLAGSFVQSANADYSTNNGGIQNGDPQDIVVSLKSNPMANLEEACLAVTFARMLAMNPANNVTLFVTLDGVSLGDKQDQAHLLMCKTPWDGEISLGGNLEAFLGQPNEHEHMVVCPICWKERYNAKPGYGVLPGATGAHGAPANAIGIMIGNADKILDF